MSVWGNQDVYGDAVVVANAPTDARVAFIRRTYAHLAGAIFAFVGLQVLLFQTAIGMSYVEWVVLQPYGHLMALVGFMVAGWVARSMARSSSGAATQYLGLGLYTLAEAVLFAPLIWFATTFSSPDVLPMAAITTLSVFAGLSGVVLFTKKDFSFIAPALGIVSFLAVGLIICAIIFGFSLGLWFSVAMAAVAGGYILYSTSNILHHYETNEHVAASLELFAAVALLFWYILQIFMRSDD